MEEGRENGVFSLPEIGRYERGFFVPSHSCTFKEESSEETRKSE
jgi:hypothetical protein